MYIRQQILSDHTGLYLFQAAMCLDNDEWGDPEILKYRDVLRDSFMHTFYHITDITFVDRKQDNNNQMLFNAIYNSEEKDKINPNDFLRECEKVVAGYKQKEKTKWI